MPTATNDGVAVHYEVDGEGETVAFVGDVGFGAWLWGWQAPAVAGGYESLVVDLRGSGRSDAPPGPYGVGALAADLEAVLAAHGARRAHVVGAGLGGMVALRYARRYNRAASLTLFGAAASGDAVDRDALAALYADPDDEAGLRASLDGAFTPAFREARPDLVDQVVEWRRETDAGMAARDAQVAAVEAFDAGPLYELTLPALVLQGVDDPVLAPDAGRALADGLPRGTYLPVEGRRLCFLEHSAAVNDELLAFLADGGEA